MGSERCRLEVKREVETGFIGGELVLRWEERGTGRRRRDGSIWRDRGK